MNPTRHFNMLMASALSVSLAATPMMGAGVAHAQNAPAAEAPGDAGWQKEFEVWRSASKAGKAADYEMYLRSYPTGKFASVAKKRIDDLNGAKAADTAKIDTQKTADVAATDTTQVRSADADGDAEKKRDLEMWRQVSKTGHQADYEKYLKEFPKGKFAKVAKSRIDAMIAEAKAPVQDQAAEVVEKPAQQDQAENQADDNTQPTDDNDQANVQSDETQPAEQAKAPANSDWEQEYALWKAASNGNTVNEYEAYLSSYPKGKFAAIAQARIVQLAAAEQPVANVDEGDTTQNEQQNTPQNNKVVKQDQADDQNQMDDQAQTDQNQADDQQTANNQADDQSQPNDMGQNTQDQQNVQYSEGTPDTEDQYLNLEGRHEMQGRLTALGYDTGGTDGSLGPRSRAAISDWQQDNGAPVTGYLSGDQIAQIRKLSQVAYNEWLQSQPVVVERVRPRREKVVIVEPVRPRREKVVIENDPGVDAAIALGVLGAVVGGHKMGKLKFRPGAVKVIGKFKFNKMDKCRKKRRC
jgi:hypothetical protein